MSGARDAVGPTALPDARKPRVQIVRRHARECRDEIDQVRFRLDAGLPAILEQREEIGEARAGESQKVLLKLDP
ncbi:MAG TPA: hypothetical protein VH559_05575 [Gemmatimonadaceae bacterium]